jgi:hypothetical protein
MIKNFLASAIWAVRFWILLLCCISQLNGFVIYGQDAILDVERQPLEASVKRLNEALEFLGEPLSNEQRAKLNELFSEAEDQKVVLELQKMLDPLCITMVSINPEGRVKVAAGKAQPHLVERGWRTFLVKVINEGGVTSPLRCSSPQAQAMVRPST